MKTLFNIFSNVSAICGLIIIFFVAMINDATPNYSIVSLIKYLFLGLFMLLPIFIRSFYE